MVRKADAFVKEGKLDQAIAEYCALLDENPGDNGAANTLGDLYARQGDTARAIEQYTRLGESEWLQGFSAKAAAFYKKALKIDPNCEGALARLGEIAASQSLFVDASRHWTRLLERRRLRGDAAGEAEVAAWLTDLQGSRKTTRRATSVGMTRREPAAAAPLATPEPVAATPAAADPANTALANTAPGNTAPADTERANTALADTAFTGIAAPAPEPLAEAAPEAPLQSERTPEAGTPQDVPFVIEQFGQVDLPAADAAAAPAEPEAEDWFAVSDLSLTTDALPVEPVPEDVQASFQDAVPVHAVHAVGQEVASSEIGAAQTSAADPVQDDWEIVVELGEQLDAAAISVPDASQPVEEPAFPSAMEEVATPVSETPAPAADASRPDSPVGEFDGDRDAALIADLIAAAETPSLRFHAGVQLGRMFLQRGDLGRGIEWLERACTVAPPVRDHGLQARYDLADALERAGHQARALEVWSDLEMEAGSYRDVSTRIARLSQAVAT